MTMSNKIRFEKAPRSRLSVNYCGRRMVESSFAGGNQALTPRMYFHSFRSFWMIGCALWASKAALPLYRSNMWNMSVSSWSCHFVNTISLRVDADASHPANTVVYCAWFILCKACGLRIDSLQRVCRSWVSVNGAVNHKVLVFGDVADVGNEAFRVSGRLSHWKVSAK